MLSQLIIDILNKPKRFIFSISVTAGILILILPILVDQGRLSKIYEVWPLDLILWGICIGAGVLWITYLVSTIYQKFEKILSEKKQERYASKENKQFLLTYQELSPLTRCLVGQAVYNVSVYIYPNIDSPYIQELLNHHWGNYYIHLSKFEFSSKTWRMLTNNRSYILNDYQKLVEKIAEIDNDNKIQYASEDELETIFASLRDTD